LERSRARLRRERDTESPRALRIRGGRGLLDPRPTASERRLCRHLRAPPFGGALHGQAPTAPSAPANGSLTRCCGYRGVFSLRTAGTNATATLAEACTAAPAISVAGMPIAAPAGPASA